MRVGYMALALTLAFVCCGCVLNSNEGYITIHGQRHWFDGNEILPANLVDPEISWGLHTGTELHQYVYHYAGQPVLLHAWWEVWQDGKKIPGPVASIATFAFGRALRKVNCNGCIVASRREATGPTGDTVCLAAQVSEESGSFESILSKAYSTAVPLRARIRLASQAEQRYEPLIVDKTQNLFTYVYYTSEHPIFKQEYPSGQCDPLPEPGKLVVKFKVRLQSIDPVQKDFVIGKGKFHIAPRHSLGAILTSSDMDMLENGSSATHQASSPE